MSRSPASLVVAAVALAALAGFVDAVAWIELAGFFAASMTGNSTRIGVGVATGDWVAVRIAAALVMMFVSGVIATSVVGHRFAGQHRAPVMLVVTLALAVAALAAWWGLVMASLLLLAFATGAQNGVPGRDGEPTMGVAYMTAALVRMGQQLAATLMGSPGDRAWAPLLLTWLAFVCGACLGAMASRGSLSGAVTIAAVAAAMMTVVLALAGGGHRRVRRI